MNFQEHILAGRLASEQHIRHQYRARLTLCYWRCAIISACFGVGIDRDTNAGQITIHVEQERHLWGSETFIINAQFSFARQPSCGARHLMGPGR